ncbi:Uncharacterised protein [Aeromonas hydrophila]|nr:Uncharacterised protein [Aeromonas hydrophila]
MNKFIRDDSQLIRLLSLNKAIIQYAGVTAHYLDSY